MFYISTCCLKEKTTCEEELSIWIMNIKKYSSAFCVQLVFLPMLPYFFLMTGSSKCFKFSLFNLAWVGRELRGYQVPNPLSKAGLPAARPSTRSDCPGPQPACPYMPTGMRRPQPFWATCSCTSPFSQ